MLILQRKIMLTFEQFIELKAFSPNLNSKKQINFQEEEKHFLLYQLKSVASQFEALGLLSKLLNFSANLRPGTLATRLLIKKNVK